MTCDDKAQATSPAAALDYPTIIATDFGNEVRKLSWFPKVNFEQLCEMHGLLQDIALNALIPVPSVTVTRDNDLTELVETLLGALKRAGSALESAAERSKNIHILLSRDISLADQNAHFAWKAGEERLRALLSPKATQGGAGE